MRIRLRLLLVFLILAFAAGMVVHAAQAAGMASEAPMATGEMAPSCNGCGDGADEKMEKACPDVCIAQAVAILSGQTAIGPGADGLTSAALIDFMTGRSATPDPGPPRPIPD